ncbi:15507_t:CDS:1, partial [Cetraspora pellucida]
LCVKKFWKHQPEMKDRVVSGQVSIIYNTRSLLGLLNRIYWITAVKNQSENIQGSFIIFGTSTNATSEQTIHSFSSSNDSSETFANEMIQRIGLNNWHNLISLTSIPHTLSDYITKIDPDNSLNVREAVFDIRDEALILLWNLAECSGISLGVSKKVMTTIEFRSANVIDGFSNTSSFDENGVNRVKFLVNRVIGKVNAKEATDQIEVTTQELSNRFIIGKNRVIEFKKRVEISENIEKQIEEQRLKPDVQAMKEARLKKFNNN